MRLHVGKAAAPSAVKIVATASTHSQCMGLSVCVLQISVMLLMASCHGLLKQVIVAAGSPRVCMLQMLQQSCRCVRDTRPTVTHNL